MMTTRSRWFTLLTAAVSCGLALEARAISYTDLSVYNAAVGPHAVIDFTGLAHGTVVTTQYAGLGVTFTDGNDTIANNSVFLDSFGVYDGGNGGSLTIEFDSPMNHFGVEFPGAATVELYDGTNLIASDQYGGSGTGFFGGLLEPSQTFDRVVVYDHFDSAGYYDNFHFGLTVPEPASLIAVAAGLAAIAAVRRPR